MTQYTDLVCPAKKDAHEYLNMLPVNPCGLLQIVRVPSAGQKGALEQKLARMFVTMVRHTPRVQPNRVQGKH